MTPVHTKPCTLCLTQRVTRSLLQVQGLSLEQSVSQFSNTMTAQADLRVEAAHLRRFLHNFRALSASITAPRPLVRPLLSCGE